MCAVERGKEEEILFFVYNNSFYFLFSKRVMFNCCSNAFALLGFDGIMEMFAL